MIKSEKVKVISVILCVLEVVLSYCYSLQRRECLAHCVECLEVFYLGCNLTVEPLQHTLASLYSASYYLPLPDLIWSDLIYSYLFLPYLTLLLPTFCHLPLLYPVLSLSLSRRRLCLSWISWTYRRILDVSLS